MTPATVSSYTYKNHIASAKSHWDGVKSFGGLLFELRVILSRLYFSVRKWGQTFQYEGTSLPYFYHRYNMTWRSERTIEIPILRKILQSFQGQRILEVGNVMSHYQNVAHDVVDKYEVDGRCLNVDIMDFQPEKPYDVVFSISTFEHMGFDEEKQAPQKPRDVLLHLKKHGVKRGGRLVATFPFGYNPHLDDMVRNGAMGFTETKFFKRISSSNQWREIELRDVQAEKYNDPFPFANILVVGILQN